MRRLDEIFNDQNYTFGKLSQINKTTKNSIIDSKNDLLIQHNNLIEARYRLSLQEKRVILWLLTQIKLDDEDFKLHKLEIMKFAELTNVAVNNRYNELKKITRRLIQRVIEIYDHKSQELIQVSWLSAARYQTKKGCVLLEFSPQLKPYLLQLKSQFTRISLGEIMQLSSIYAVRFYELLKQYEPIGKRKISVENLREYCGIDKQEYKKYNNLKKDVLERAKKEINEKTDINIDYIEIKESRKIVTIEWIIHKKDLVDQKHLDKIDFFEKELRSEQVIINSLLEYGFSKAVAKRLLLIHDEVTVKNAIHAVDLQIEKGKAKNPKAMIRIAIEEKWHPEIFKTKKTNSSY